MSAVPTANMRLVLTNESGDDVALRACLIYRVAAVEYLMRSITAGAAVGVCLRKSRALVHCRLHTVQLALTPTERPFAGSEYLS